MESDLILQFDINKTILMIDSTKISNSFQTTLKSAISSHAWGRVVDGQWIPSEYPVSQKCPEQGLVSHWNYILSIYKFILIEDEPDEHRREE